MTWRIGLALGLGLALGCGWIPLEAQRPKIRTEQVATGTARNKLSYHVRVPRAFDPKKNTLPAFVFLHDKDENAKHLLETAVLQWPRLARKSVFVGIDGDQASGEGDELRFRYSSDEPGRRISASKQVVQVLEEIRDFLPVKFLFLVGYGQGAEVAYQVLMNHPQSVDGVCAVAGKLPRSAEPSAFSNKKLRKAQRKVPVVIVHGVRDRSVLFSRALTAYELLEDDGFTWIRFEPGEGATHDFPGLPVDDAIDWLLEMTQQDLSEVFEFAQRARSEGAMRDHILAIKKARGLDKGQRYADRLTAMDGLVRREAAEGASHILLRMRMEPGEAWIDEFLEFRSQYGLADASRSILKLYGALRVKHIKPGGKLVEKARTALAQGRRDEARPHLEEIVEKYFASPWYRWARRELDED